MKFHKYHALGNDYLVLDPKNFEKVPSSEAIRRICHRNLGIGSDGHIGFNEPCSSLSSRTRMKTLTGETIKDNARFFESENDVPRHCITMGVGTILDTKSVLLFAFGEGKSDVISKAIEGPISSMVPASALQLHPKVKVILDEPAASKLVNIDYYKEVYANRPSS